jgi:CubicO group peptidase (beta-lactamase class C family)
MRRALFALILVITALPPFPAFPAEWARLDRFLEEHRRRFKLPGAALTVVDEEGPLHHWSGGTWASTQNPSYLGSLSKALTAAAVLRLQQLERLSLEDRLLQWLPELRISGPGAEQLTLVDLLEHRSGFSRADGFIDIPPLEELAAAPELELHWRPGSRESYSNLNYLLLGLIIERASGRPFAEYIDGQLFTPLRMHRSSAAAEPEGRPVPNYQYWFGIPLRKSELSYSSTAIPAGFITSSPADMGRFLTARLNDGNYRGRRVLAPLRPARPVASAAATGTRVAGWRVANIGEERLLHMDGATAGSYGFMALLPERGTAFIFMTNVNAYNPILSSIEEIPKGILSFLLEREMGSHFPFHLLLLGGFGLLFALSIYSLLKELVGWMRAGRPVPSHWPAGSLVRILAGHLLLPGLLTWLLLRSFGIGFAQLLVLQPDIALTVIAGILSGFLSRILTHMRTAPAERGGTYLPPG